MRFKDIKERLRIYHQAKPDSWQGQCIGRLYEVYCKVQWRFKDRLLREVDEIKGQHLALGVGYVSIAEVDGDIAEFGTMSGETAQIIAKAMVTFPENSKSLCLFDSFKGLPVALSPVDEMNPHVKSGGWAQGLLMGINENRLVAKVHKVGLSRDKIKVYAGWFCETLPKLPDDTKFAMLHIDCDLYQSTIDVLDECFSRGFVAEGAIILFDDWNSAMASPLMGERRAWSEMIEKYSVVYSDEGGYSWSSHKFIIHSYSKKERLMES